MLELSCDCSPRLTCTRGNRRAVERAKTARVPEKSEEYHTMIVPTRIILRVPIHRRQADPRRHRGCGGRHLKLAPPRVGISPPAVAPDHSPIRRVASRFHDASPFCGGPGVSRSRAVTIQTRLLGRFRRRGLLAHSLGHYDIVALCRTYRPCLPRRRGSCRPCSSICWAAWAMTDNRSHRADAIFIDCIKQRLRRPDSRHGIGFIRSTSSLGVPTGRAQGQFRCRWPPKGTRRRPRQIWCVILRAGKAPSRDNSAQLCGPRFT